VCCDYTDEPNTSEVHAYWEDDGTMTATIKTDTDIYYVEVSLTSSENQKCLSKQSRQIRC